MRTCEDVSYAYRRIEDTTSGYWRKPECVEGACGELGVHVERVFSNVC